MPIDYPRLMQGMNGTAVLVNGGVGGLPAVTELITVLTEAAGADGATFTEYGPEGGRVVAAVGGLTWALGQPIGPEFYRGAETQPAWTGLVEVLPVPIAEPLLARGLLRLAGHVAAAGGRVVGAVHVYFGDTAADDNTGLLSAVGVVANAVAGLYAARSAPAPGPGRRDEDRDLFLAVTGHELRTPATVIKGYANTLVDRWEALDERSRRKAAGVLAQRADELARLVDRLLAAAGGEPAAGWPTRLVPFDLVEAVVRATNELPGELRGAVRARLPNGLPLAQGDPGSLTSILGELVVNAVRHGSPLGGVDPSTVVELDAYADERTVFLRVADRGVGIDPANSERAFERFWQGARSSESRRGGVGLGLYLVRRLVERQNGWVSLRPRDGGGTVVEVRLPRADGPVSPGGSRSPAVSGEA